MSKLPPQPPIAPRTGGQILVDALKIHEVDSVFCVPGESYLAVLDALHDARNQIRTITCRQEGGAACMADAYARATGQPGVLMVTRAPGACNASIGLHIAHQDSVPLVVLIGQIAREEEYRESFQEIDYHEFYRPLTKWVAQVESAERLPELISQAFHRATSGRPGPVALALPEDMLTDVCEVADTRKYSNVQPEMSLATMRSIEQQLDRAQRPMAIVGGPGWSAASGERIQRFLEHYNIPTAADFRCMDRIDNASDCYVGDLGIALNPTLAKHMREADLILAIGSRLGEKATAGYSLLQVPCPTQQLIHIFPDPSELGRVYQAQLAVCASVQSFADCLAELNPQPAAAGNAQRACWMQATRDAYLNYRDNPTPMPGPLNLGQVMAHLRERMPADTILTSDAGNFSGWIQRHYAYHSFPSLLAPGSGAMGYGVPAAVAARLAHPNRCVLGFCGDGGVMMSGQEIATAVHHGIDPVIVVFNNNMFGTIRMHQEREYPTRVHATDLSNPDFVAWASSFGAYAERVTRTEEFEGALERALKAGKIALLELVVDPQVLTTSATLDQVRERALSASSS